MNELGRDGNGQFGLPLSPFPPGVRWTTVRDMLHEMMSDFHRGWVQDYFLRPDALADVQVLMSPLQLTKSAAFTMHAKLGENFYQNFGSSEMFMVGLVVPRQTVDDIFTGLVVQSHAGHNCIGDRTDLTSRGIINVRTKTLLEVVWNSESGTVDLNCAKTGIDEPQLQVTLKFKSRAFARALESIPGRIDFDMLEKALVMSAISNIERANALSCVVKQSSLSASRGEMFPHREFFVMGDWLGRCVISHYKDAVLQKTQPGMSLMSREYGAHYEAVDKMKNWAVRDLLSLLKPVPRAPISICQDSDDGVGSDFKGHCKSLARVILEDFVLGEIFEQLPPTELFSDPYLVDEEAGFPIIPPAGFPLLNEALNIRDGARSEFVPIAPLRGSSYEAKPAAETEDELLKLNKFEMRKIRNREAAARSNAKRRERRKLARTQQRQAIEGGLSQ